MTNDRPLTIESVDPLHPDAIFLLHEAAKEIRPLYGVQDAGENLPSNPPFVPRSAYLIARVDGKPVGSAALRPLDETIGELKRMYVLPAFRGQGVARALLAEIEKAALGFGYAAIRLETGNRQVQAIALYEACGYQRIPPFGEYANDLTSVCFEKSLFWNQVRRKVTHPLPNFPAFSAKISTRAIHRSRS